MRNTVNITLEVDDKGSVKIKQLADESKKAFGEMKKGPEAAQRPLSVLGEGWVGLTAKVTLATGVIYGVSRAISAFVDEAAEAETIEKRLQFALDTTGYSWTTAKTAVDQFAKSIMETTRFSDEHARQALTDMMMYTNEYAKAEQGARLAMDMSIRTGMDLGSSTRLIGMAMTGNVEMLGRYLPQLRNLDAVLGENASMAEKAAYALKVLQEKFGGTAQADLDTYSGKLQQFKNHWKELKEEWGTHLLPILGTILERLTGIARVLSTRPKAGLYEQLAEWEGLTPFINIPTPYPTESERRFMGWGMTAAGKKDIFPEKKPTGKEIADEAKGWGEYADAVLAENEKLYLTLAELNKDYWDNREEMNKRIMEGEQDLANTTVEAWAMVYQTERDLAKSRLEDAQRAGTEQLAILEAQVAKAKEARDVQVSLGWMRPAQAGLADLEENKKLYEAQLEQRKLELKLLEEQGTDLDAIFNKQQQILEINKQISVIEEKSKLYVSEYGTAFDGVISGLKKYQTEAGTIFTQTEEMTKNILTSTENAFSDFFQSIFDKNKTWADRTQALFKSLFNSIIKNLSDTLAKNLTTGLLGGGSQGGGNQYGWVGQIIGLLGGAVKGIFGTSTTSTTAGSAGSYSSMNWGGGADYSAFGYHAGKGPGGPPTFYRPLPKFHSGVGPEEVLSVIRKDESVLTPAQMKALAPAGNTISINVPISFATPIDQKKARRLADEIETIVVQKLKDFSR